MAQLQLTDGKIIGYLAKGTLSLAFFALQSCTLFTNSNPNFSQRIKEVSFNQAELRDDLKTLTISPHPFGSERQKELALWLEKKSAAIGLKVSIQKFIATTPNPVIFHNKNAPANNTLTKIGYNVIATLPGKKDCNILFGSHYDTKVIGSEAYLGANDSGSSSAALFQIARSIKVIIPDNNQRCDITFIWFDGEEPVLPDWTDGETKYPTPIQDNTYGSRYFVNQLKECNGFYCRTKNGKKIIALILLDMIGSEKLLISLDENSDKNLRSLLKDAAKSLNLEHRVSSHFQTIADDHIPFKEKGIPAIDLIDFHNLQHWHKPSDKLSAISLNSIEEASKLAMHIYMTLDARIK